MAKWGAGGAKNCLEPPRLSIHPTSISSNPGAHSPEAGAEGKTGVAPGADGWALYCNPNPQVLTVNKETPRSRVGRLTVPETRLPRRPRRRGPEGTGRGGGVRTCLRGRGPAASAVPRDQHPTPSPRHRRHRLTALASSRSLRAHLQLERCAGPSSPAPLPAPPPRLTPRPNQTPCFCFEFSTPQGGGTRDSPRRDPSLPQQTLKKSSVSQHSPQPVL